MPKLDKIIKNIATEEEFSAGKKFSRINKLHKYWSRKPWFIIDEFLKKFSRKGDTVLDPFCGSGVIGLEAILNGRNFIGYDLNPFAIFLTRETLRFDFDKKSFREDFKRIEVSVREIILNQYRIGEEYILYAIKGKKNDKKYNAVLADGQFKNKRKVLLPNAALIKKFRAPFEITYPDCDFPQRFYKDRFSYKGVKRVSDMFSERNLFSLAVLYKEISKLNSRNRDTFLLAFTNTLLHVSKLKSENVRPLSVNNYWIPDDYIEENVWWRFQERVRGVEMAKEVIMERAEIMNSASAESETYNKSSLSMVEIQNSQIDYLITDPPYGDTIQYSELSYIWNCWLGKEFQIDDEVIVNPVQEKGRDEYFQLLDGFIVEAKRVLKRGRLLTLAFHNKDVQMWVQLTDLLREHGFELIDISSYDPVGSSYNKNWSKFSPKSDFYVTLKNARGKGSPLEKNPVDMVDIIGKLRKSLLRNNLTPLPQDKLYDCFIATLIFEILSVGQIPDSTRLNIKDIVKLLEHEGLSGRKADPQFLLFGKNKGDD